MAGLTFHGAVEGVTGSAYLLQTKRATVLLECGLVQGSPKAEKANEKPFPFAVESIDAVVLSHAHLDHSGRLPRLARDGYGGQIILTRATGELLEIMLKDAAYLQKKDAEWENKRRRRAGKREIEPLFTEQDVQQILAQCEEIDYGRRWPVAPGVHVCFRDAGHILGSAIVELFIDEGGREQRLVFSGDLGNSEAALMRDPEILTSADAVLMESTYGDRNHRSMEDTLDEFRGIILEAGATGGNVLIPSFAVGRTQEVIFRLGEMYQQGDLRQQAVFLDSPMAIAVTEVYHRHHSSFNSEDRDQMRQSHAPSLHKFLPVLRYSRSTEESMAINRLSEGAIIIAGSGMCNGGRIRHHFKHNLWRQRTHVLFVGYQASGTPGRALVDGVKSIQMGGERIAVKAAIHTLGGFSAHASQAQLVDWVNHFAKVRPRLYLVHGEDDAKLALRERLAMVGWDTVIAAQGQTVTL